MFKYLFPVNFEVQSSSCDLGIILVPHSSDAFALDFRRMQQWKTQNKRYETEKGKWS